MPLAIMGVTAKTTFADSYYNSPRDFWVHDANHSRRLYSANQQYFKRNNIETPEARLDTYKKWDEFIQDKVMPATQILSSMPEHERNLRKTVKVALFEVYHEQALTPSKEDLVRALNFQPGGGSAFEIILDPENPDQPYEARRLENFNIDSGTTKYQSDMAPRTIKYFHQSAPNIVTNLYDKLTREFYDSRHGSINDLPPPAARTPELVADAMMRVVDLYEVESSELGLSSRQEMRARFLDLARNHDSSGKPLGQAEIYHQKELIKPSLKPEVVHQILENRSK